MIDRWLEPDDELELAEEEQEEESDDISPDMIDEAEYDYECKVFREGRFA